MMLFFIFKKWFNIEVIYNRPPKTNSNNPKPQTDAKKFNCRKKAEIQLHFSDSSIQYLKDIFGEIVGINHVPFVASSSFLPICVCTSKSESIVLPSNLNNFNEFTMNKNREIET